MKKFSGHTEPWGDFVDVKINAHEILEHQLKRLKKNSHISFGTVCDAYQPIESKYMITRKCLEKLVPHHHSISILTKSNLVLRDLDLLRQLRNLEVGFTITCLDPKIARVFEPGAPAPEKRFQALRSLSQNKIFTWVFVAPTLPYLTDSENTIKDIMTTSKKTGAQYVMFDTLNPYPRVWHNIKRLINKYFPEAKDFYDYYYNNRKKYKGKLKNRITKIGRINGIKCRFAF